MPLASVTLGANLVVTPSRLTVISIASSSEASLSHHQNGSRRLSSHLEPAVPASLTATTAFVDHQSIGVGFRNVKTRRGEAAVDRARRSPLGDGKRFPGSAAWILAAATGVSPYLVCEQLT